MKSETTSKVTDWF